MSATRSPSSSPRATSAALDAAERIEVDYRALPAVVDGAAALAPAAPRLWDEIPGNLAYRFQKGDERAAEAALAAAAHVVELELVNNRIIVTPIEPRAAIGSYDKARACFHLILTGPGVHAIRQQLADTVFHVPPERVHVSAPDVGGGFGMKNALYPEWVMLLWAARRLGRPVKWIAERGEDFVSYRARPRQPHARASGARRGRPLPGAGCLDHRQSRRLPLDAAVRAARPTRPPTPWAGAMSSPPIFMDVQGAFTNTVPIDAYRGAGKPEANY